MKRRKTKLQQVKKKITSEQVKDFRFEQLILEQVKDPTDYVIIDIFHLVIDFGVYKKSFI